MWILIDLALELNIRFSSTVCIQLGHALSMDARDDGKRETGKHEIILQEVVENARLENAGPIYTGGKCGTGKCGTIIQVGGKRETSSYGTPTVPVL